MLALDPDRDHGTERTLGLEANWLLAGLPPSEWRAIEPFARIVLLDPRTFVRRAGEPLSHMYFLASGLITLELPMADGGSVCVAMVGREGVVGMSAWLGHATTAYDLECCVAGRAICLPVAPLTAMASRLPHFTHALRRYLHRRLQEAARNAACNALHTVEQRLARWLLLARNRIGSDRLPITQELLARMLGVRRPFVNHVINSLRRVEVIEHMRGSVGIVNPARLQSIACEDFEPIETTYAQTLVGLPDAC